MLNTRLRAFALVAMVAAISTTSSAHHSHGNYDVRNYTYLDGTISEIVWLNPHIWIYLDVETEDGSTTTWALEGASISEVAREGWSREDLNVGDKLAARCHALRDGASGCLLGYLTTEGGEERVFD